jgi:hypothetical protein
MMTKGNRLGPLEMGKPLIRPDRRLKRESFFSFRLFCKPS